MSGGSVPNCIACRHGEGTHRGCRYDIVQRQKEAWERIAREEREGKRRPLVVRW